jgi:hypothetical protein
MQSYWLFKQVLRMKFGIVFWDVLPCKIIVDRRFRGTCCLYHQGWVSHGWVHPRRQFWTSYSPPWELEIWHRYYACSCRWSETTSPNCDHQQDYCSSPRWYMSMENNGGMMLTGENQITRRETRLSKTLSLTNPTWTILSLSRQFQQRMRIELV